MPTLRDCLGILIFCAACAACSPQAAAPATQVAAAATTAASRADSPEQTFPLRVEHDKRYLVDAAGNPFLIRGDAAWSLIAVPTEGEVDTYLQDRHSRGFNTLLVNLLEHRYAPHAPLNADGQGPFLTPGDYSTPNEQYFAHADRVLRRAAEHGFLVLLAPSFLGYTGTDHGWYREMQANGVAKLREFGRYLGRRYRDFPNILWVHAGDMDPPDKELVEALAAGIAETDPQALATAHCGPDTAAIEYWGDRSWLQVDTIYSHHPVYIPALIQYARAERMPFFLIESVYENEHDVSQAQLRAQAYQALLSGAAGEVFGNNPVWNFNGNPPYPVPLHWQNELGSVGTRSMGHVHDLFAAHKWWTLAPDDSHSFVLLGRGAEWLRTTAAVAADRSFALIYVPTLRHVLLNLHRITGSRVRATWFDPADGTSRPDSGSPYSPGVHLFQAPGKNSAGDGDWVLVLEAV